MCSPSASEHTQPSSVSEVKSDSGAIQARSVETTRKKCGQNCTMYFNQPASRPARCPIGPERWRSRDRGFWRDLARPAGLEPATLGLEGRERSQPTAADPGKRGRLSRIVAVRRPSWTPVPERLANSCKRHLSCGSPMETTRQRPLTFFATLGRLAGTRQQENQLSRTFPRTPTWHPLLRQSGATEASLPVSPAKPWRTERVL